MTPEREPLPTRVQDTEDLPPEYRDAVRRGLADLGVDPSATALVAIEVHVRLLLAWTVAINLTGIREPAAVALGHVIDSLAAVPWLLDRRPERLLDLGSGGGFPGLPLAAALPPVEVTLVEPIAKKSRFLAVVTEAIDLSDRVTVAVNRVETLAADPFQRDSWPVVTARAVASMADLIELAFPLLAPGGSLVAWKRGDLDTELAAARRACNALGGGTLEVKPVPVAGLVDHRLVIATRTGVVPVAYPRDPAARRRRPW